MAMRTAEFDLPPVTMTDDGNPRMVGFELEFSGITLDDTAKVVERVLGGSSHVRSAVEQVVRVDGLGDFRIELDWDFLKRKAAEDAPFEEIGHLMEKLSQAAAILVPVEVVCPPIPVTDLDALNPIVAALREAGAIGTEESLIAAYGVHINPEIPSLDAATLHSYLKAFALLQWWLVDIHEVDTTRKISPYIDLYPETYLNQVISKPKASMDEIFADYLEHNASRNRALDLLPLLAEIDEDRVRAKVDDPKIKPRPTFHYRMPNCHIERPDWSLAAAWNTWCVLERLCRRREDLEALSRKFLDAARPILGVGRSEWVALIDQWLKDQELA